MRLNTRLLSSVCALLLLGCAALACADLDFRVVAEPAPVEAKALNFSVVARSSESIAAAAKRAEVLDFSVISDPPALLAERPTRKEIVRAYVDFKACPPCLTLYQQWRALTPEQRDKLPFELDFRDPAQWVDVTPKMHWQTPTGRWRQYDWQGKASSGNLLADFERVYRKAH